MRRGRSAPWIRDDAGRASAASERPHLALVHLRRARAARSRSRRFRASAAGRSTGWRTRRGKRATSAFPASRCSPTRPANLRSEDAREALNPDNLICRAIKAIKDAVPEVGVLTDVALDPYTAHGHDGLTDEHGRVLNDETTEVLVEQALVQAGGGRRHRRPVGHDGRPRRRDPRGAGARGLFRRRDHGLCRQICLGLLRPVPRRGRLARPAEGRQARLPDGPGQRRRGAARSRARHRRGRGHGDGEAGPALSRRARAG